MSKSTAPRPRRQPKPLRAGRAPKTLPKRPLTAADQTRTAPRRRAPKPRSPAHYRSKLTIAIAPADYTWVTQLAAERNVSVSSIFTEALHKLKHYTDLGRLLELVGGTADITDEDRLRTEAEMREHGLIP